MGRCILRLPGGAESDGASPVAVRVRGCGRVEVRALCKRERVCCVSASLFVSPPLTLSLLSFSAHSHAHAHSQQANLHHSSFLSVFFSGPD